MRRAAFVFVLFLLLLLLVVPIGVGATMDGMRCPDCALSGGSAPACFALLLGLATIMSIGAARRRLAAALLIVPMEGGPGALERPPR
jgi:hypothetical protein